MAMEIKANNIDDAFVDGLDAYRYDKKLSDNPYCSFTEEDFWQAWKNGFYQAAEDD